MENASNFAILYFLLIAGQAILLHFLQDVNKFDKMFRPNFV